MQSHLLQFSVHGVRNNALQILQTFSIRMLVL